MWRAASRLRCPASCACALSRGPSSSAPFHSTPIAAAKWKAKFDYDKSEKKCQQPSKNYAKYIVRQKRSDAKRVLNEFLLKGGYKRNVQAEWESWYVRTSKGSDEDDQPYHPGNGNERPKIQKQSTRKAKQSGKKRKKWNFVTDDEQYTETIFESSFGGKSYTWSFRSQNEGDSQSYTTGFKWRDDPTWAKDGQRMDGTGKQTSYWTNNRRGWECESDVDDDDDDDIDVGSSNVGSCSHRIALGLPPTGPLKLHDVKAAFRACALKWHPDKHQGSSQAAAVEKFRLCVDAYNSLCRAVTAASVVM